MPVQTLVGTPDPPEPERLFVHYRAVKGRFLTLCRATCRSRTEWTDDHLYVTCTRCAFIIRRSVISGGKNR